MAVKAVSAAPETGIGTRPSPSLVKMSRKAKQSAAAKGRKIVQVGSNPIARRSGIPGKRSEPFSAPDCHIG